MSEPMSRMRSEHRRDVLVAIIVAITVAVVLCTFIGWGVVATATAKKDQRDQIELACIAAGGTWIHDDQACLQLGVSKVVPTP